MTCRITDKYGTNVSGYFQCDSCDCKHLYEYDGDSYGNKVDVEKDRNEFIRSCVNEIKQKGWIVYKNKDTNEWNHKCPQCIDLERSIVSNEYK